MSRKKIIIIITIILILLIIIGIWIGGIIPKFIAKIAADNYLKTNFPKKQFEYVGIEWSKYHDDYIISFKDKDNNRYGCTIGPKYFPVNLGQGLFAIEEAYKKEFGEKKDSSQATTEYEFVAEIIEVDENHIMVKPDVNSREIKSGNRISIGITREADGTNDFYVVGNKIKITYDGTIMATYPLKINAIKIDLVNENNSIENNDIQSTPTENNQVENNPAKDKWDVGRVSIKIKEGSVTNESATIIITDKNENPISWTVDFLVEVKKDEIWEPAPQLAEVNWVSTLIAPDENGITEMNCNWKVLYNKLESGTYRIVKNSYSQQYDKVYSEPFIIE